MKKIFALILCIVLILGATSMVAFAEEAVTEDVTTEEVVEDKPITDVIVDYIKSNLEEIAVIVSLIAACVYKIQDRRKLNGSLGTLNNNAIAIAENSTATVSKALDEVKDIAKVVMTYKDEFADLISEARKNAEEKQSLEAMLADVNKFLKSAKLATLELSNEVAELLVLANIPNSKKEELYARHTKAVHELEVVEEAISHDGKEA